jgi:hypothetical protein
LRAFGLPAKFADQDNNRPGQQLQKARSQQQPHHQKKDRRVQEEDSDGSCNVSAGERQNCSGIHETQHLMRNGGRIVLTVI